MSGGTGEEEEEYMLSVMAAQEEDEDEMEALREMETCEDLRSVTNEFSMGSGVSMKPRFPNPFAGLDKAGRGGGEEDGLQFSLSQERGLNNTPAHEQSRGVFGVLEGGEKPKPLAFKWHSSDSPPDNQPTAAPKKREFEYEYSYDSASNMSFGDNEKRSRKSLRLDTERERGREGAEDISGAGNGGEGGDIDMEDECLDEELERIRRKREDVRARVKAYRQRHLLNREPAGESMAVSALDGRRFFMRVREEHKERPRLVVTSKGIIRGGSFGNEQPGANSSFLEKSFHEMYEELNNARMEMLLNENEDPPNLGDGMEVLGEAGKKSDIFSTGYLDRQDTQLWVDKYAPKSFFDLLSDDRTNRELYRWLKQWDRCVKGKAKDKKKKVLSARGREEQQKKDFFNGFRNFEDEQDELKRPAHRLALLYGPPGLGKTTLAHVLARQAGYHPVEINASDDRSPEVLMKRIQAATEMRSVFGGDGQKPNCLIIDEIDGALVEAVNVLVRMANGTANRKGGTSDKKKKSVGLLRPIICICNDLQAPAVKPLKTISASFLFQTTNPVRLTSRLREICVKEGLKIDNQALNLLCQMTEFDIRSSLNTLQFLRRKTNHVTADMLKRLNIGQKDKRRGIFHVWESLFGMINASGSNTASAGCASIGGAKAAREEKSKGRIARFYNMLTSSSEHDTIMRGLFENYLSVRIIDTDFVKASSLHEWIDFYDMVDTKIKHTQQYSLMKYLPFAEIAFNRFYNTNQHSRVRFPMKEHRVRQKQKTVQLVAEQVFNNMAALQRAFVSIRTLVLDVISPLVDIITPPIRPVNAQLLSVHERSQLDMLVSAMVQYGISYKQVRLECGSYRYIFDPDIEVIFAFSDTDDELENRKGKGKGNGQNNNPLIEPNYSHNHRRFNYNVRQLIAQEIVVLQARGHHSSSAPSTANIGQNSRTPMASKTKSVYGGSAPGSSSSSPSAVTAVDRNTNASLSDITRRCALNTPSGNGARKVNPEKHVYRDFFGRIITTPPAKKKGKEKMGAEAKGADTKGNIAVSGSSIYFKYHEGYSNAVRKVVRISDLLEIKQA
eukprot:Nk52_evm31s233 gene=Nk52_evmTU31s233